MNNREQDLVKIKEYIDSIDKETTLLLQNLQWDHKHLIESPTMVSCKYMAEHRIPQHSVEAHEKQCYLMQEGYSKEDVLLPDTINPIADTVVKLSKQDIMKIINTAASMDSSFKRGSGAAEPLSIERLQHAYSADERRAIHDAVVSAAPACHDLAELALGSLSGGSQASKVKSRTEILAELRDMKRRRAKYRVAAKTANYSDVLRDVIKIQMEMYAEAKGIFIKTEYGAKNYVSLNKSAEIEKNSTKIVIKQERISPETEVYRHRERSKSIDRRMQGTEYHDRITVSKKSRDHYYDENNSDKRKYKDLSQDKYSKERGRFDYGHSKRDTNHRHKDTSTNETSNRHDSNKTGESSTSKHVGKYNENYRKLYKYDDKNYIDASKNACKYESCSKTHIHRSYKEDSSKDSKYDYRRKYDDPQRIHKESNRHREDKHRRRYDQIKKEKDDYYEDPNEDRKKRERH